MKIIALTVQIHKMSINFCHNKHVTVKIDIFDNKIFLEIQSTLTFEQGLINYKYFGETLFFKPII